MTLGACVKGGKRLGCGNALTGNRYQQTLKFVKPDAVLSHTINFALMD